MEEIFNYIMLDAKDPKDNELFDETSSIDVDNLLGTGKKACSDACFSILFEEPNEDMISAIKIRRQTKRVDFAIYFRDAFYKKHIGKYMDGVKILNKVADAMMKAMDSVCWRAAAGHGCGGGCHG